MIGFGKIVNGIVSFFDAGSGLNRSRGRVSGQSTVHKFGNAPDFDTADGEVTIWDGAEDGTAWEQMVYQYSATADIDSISSSSASDTHDIVVQGLDTNYDEVSMTVTLNGQTRVALPTALIRNPRTYNDNGVASVGHVVVYVNTALTAGIPTDSTQIRSVVDPVNEQTQQCTYTVPAGKTAYMRSWYASTSGANRESNYVIKLKARLFGKVFRVKHVQTIEDGGTSAYQHTYYEPVAYPEKTDIEMTAEALSSPAATGAAVSAGFDLVLVDD